MTYYIVELNIKNRQIRIIDYPYNRSDANERVVKMLERNNDLYIIYAYWDEDQLITWFKSALHNHPYDIHLPL